jgi:N-acetyl-anhydromuramyl-L-alanine amidase AmpD
MDKGELLGQVSDFSDRIKISGSSGRSPWASGGWPRVPELDLEAPEGAVVHYTADADLMAVLRWFLDPGLGAKASAHYVVGAWWTDDLRKLAAGLPLVEALEVPLVEVVSPDRVAWHARSANHTSLGVEVVNAGRVRQVPGTTGWRRWQPERRGAEEWTSEYDVSQGVPTLQCLDRLHWYAPYQAGQAQVVTRVVAAAAQALRGEAFDPVRIVGHEHVQRNKQDPGPSFPLELVRGVGLGRISAAEQLWAAGGDILIRARYDSRPVGHDAARDRLALEALGYLDDGLVSVEMFQRMMGLDPDGDIGPRTCAALGERLEEVGFRVVAD